MISSGKLGLQRMILGNLPMLGISYQGKRKDDEFRGKFSDKDEMKRVMKVAIRYEVSLFSAASPDFNELAPTYLKAIEEIQEEEETELSLITCTSVPLELRGRQINDYRRWKTHLNHELKEFGREVRERFLEDPVLNCRPGWKENLRLARPYKVKDLERDLKVDWRLWEEHVNSLSDFRISWIEPGSETDFLAFSRMDLLEELLDRIHEFGYRSLLGSHHLGASFRLIEARRVKRFDGYVTPINTLGVMMFPTQRVAEKALRRARKMGRSIVAIKPFAGGRIRPKEALNYVYKKLKADSCMMGVGSVEEAEEDFRAARGILEKE
jgi:hypothetical protein